jgi:hypothetical protein
MRRLNEKKKHENKRQVISAISFFSLKILNLLQVNVISPINVSFFIDSIYMKTIKNIT